MAFTMKSNVPGLLGINAELSTYSVPVFEKDLPNGIWGAANIDRTIVIEKDLKPKDKKSAVEHEMMHIMQFKNGSVRYDNKNVYYKPNKGSATEIFPLASIRPGNHKLPWEKSIYDKTKTYAK